MFEVSIPQDYGIKESIALVTNKVAKQSAAYKQIKLAFAQKLISFQDVTLDDYESVTIMQEDKRYSFPFLIITDGLTREILNAKEAMDWVEQQEPLTPRYNGSRIYYTFLPDVRSNPLDHIRNDTGKAVDDISIDFVETDRNPILDEADETDDDISTGFVETDEDPSFEDRFCPINTDELPF